MHTPDSRLAKIMRPRDKKVRTNTRNSAFPRALQDIWKWPHFFMAKGSVAPWFQSLGRLPLIEPVHEISNNVVCATNKGSDQSAHTGSDQSLCLSLEYSISVRLLTEHLLEVLSLKGGCTSWSESTLVKIPHCWKSHVIAQ